VVADLDLAVAAHLLVHHLIAVVVVEEEKKILVWGPVLRREQSLRGARVSLPVTEVGVAAEEVEVVEVFRRRVVAVVAYLLQEAVVRLSYSWGENSNVLYQ